MKRLCLSKILHLDYKYVYKFNNGKLTYYNYLSLEEGRVTQGVKPVKG